MAGTGSRRVVLSVVCLAAALCQAAESRAEGETREPAARQDAERPEGWHEHDGLMLSVQVVGGYLGFYSDSWIDDFELPSAQVFLSAGYSVSDAVGLLGEVTAGYPGVFGGGGGVRFFLPANSFINVTAGVIVPGALYGRAALGKEWWVSTNWGIGLVLSSMLAGCPGEDGTLVVPGLGLSATFN